MPKLKVNKPETVNDADPLGLWGKVGEPDNGDSVNEYEGILEDLIKAEHGKNVKAKPEDHVFSVKDDDPCWALAADKVGCKVHGTTGKGTYTFLGKNKSGTLAVAARRIGSKLSIRVEGAVKANNILSSLKFSTAKPTEAGHYYRSVHLSIGDTTQLTMTLASILAVLEVEVPSEVAILV